MPFFSPSEDVKIFYDAWPEGDGEWITLLGGYTRTTADFKGMGRFLAGRGWRVIAVDSRGAGKAECPPAFTIDDIAGDVAALWGHLKVGKSHLFAMGYGAAVALTLAAAEPARVAAMVLVGAPVEEPHLAVEARGPSRDPRRFQNELLRYFSPAFLTGSVPVVQGYVRQMARVFQEPDSALGAACQRASMAGLDLAPRLPSIGARTLLVHGEHDNVVPPEASRTLAAGIAGATLETWAGLGHLILAEAPMKLYERVDEFCRGGGA